MRTLYLYVSTNSIEALPKWTTLCNSMFNLKLGRFNKYSGIRVQIEFSKKNFFFIKNVKFHIRSNILLKSLVFSMLLLAHFQSLFSWRVLDMKEGKFEEPVA